MSGWFFFDFMDSLTSLLCMYNIELDELRGAKMTDLSNEIAGLRASLDEKDRILAHIEWSSMQKQSMYERQ